MKKMILGFCMMSLLAIGVGGCATQKDLEAVQAREKAIAAKADQAAQDAERRGRDADRHGDGRVLPALLQHHTRYAGPAQEIRETARTYATTRPACIQWGQGIDASACTGGFFQTPRVGYSLFLPGSEWH